MEKGVIRWIVDVSKWDPPPELFSSTLSLLPSHEHASILRFYKLEDRKRALVSRLLQYALVHRVLGLPYDDILIKRTSQGKPHLDCNKDLIAFPNFNFNASHHGDYVAIASEPLCLVGVDIVSYDFPQNESVSAFIGNFKSHFSSPEWNSITTAGNCEEILVEFYRYWCVKEAFVKAVGSGVGFGLDRVEFHHTNWNNISVKIDGTSSPEWKFWLFEWDNKHCVIDGGATSTLYNDLIKALMVSIARGHPRLAAEGYKRNLDQVDFNEDEFLKGLHLPSGNFVLQTIEELISVVQKAKYDGAKNEL